MLTPAKRNVLFIVHEASFTGAPILLLNLLKLLQKEQGISFSIIILRGGPLENAFKKIASCIVLKPTGYSVMPKNFSWFKAFLFHKFKVVRMFLKAVQCDVIFGNTVVTSAVLHQLRWLRKPMLVYIHELKNVIEHYSNFNKGIHLLKKDASLFLYPGNTVKKVLESEYQVQAPKLKALNYYIPVNRYAGNTVANRLNLNMPDTIFTVCGVGTASLRKGTDIFIETAKAVCERANNISFYWVGGFENESIRMELEQKVKKYQLENKLFFTGAVAPEVVEEAYQHFGLLFLSSREDPYPLVVLEAAGHYLPAVVFKNSGGIVEFVESDAGWIINDFSPAAAADLIIQLSGNKKSLQEKGKNAKVKLDEKHNNEILVLTQFFDALQAIS
ncbi:MAG: glycosyltransferase family 4 protein [Bacteroidetes bacterium]|nr:glycosyltransferase family 4 protein [Bacteroidota bacterium]